MCRLKPAPTCRNGGSPDASKSDKWARCFSPRIRAKPGSLPACTHSLNEDAGCARMCRLKPAPTCRNGGSPGASKSDKWARCFSPRIRAKPGSLPACTHSLNEDAGCARMCRLKPAPTCRNGGSPDASKSDKWARCFSPRIRAKPGSLPACTHSLKKMRAAPACAG